MCRFCSAKLCYRRLVQSVSSALFKVQQIFRNRDGGIGSFQSHTVSIVHVDRECHCTADKLHAFGRPINLEVGLQKDYSSRLCPRNIMAAVSSRQNEQASD